MQVQQALKLNSAVEVMRVQAVGPQLLSLQILDACDVILGVSKYNGDVKLSDVLTADNTNHNDVSFPYNADGSTVAFTGQSLGTAVVPGTFLINSSAGCPAIKDTLKDGNLYLDGPARVVGTGGSIAAAASESFEVNIDGKGTMVVTLGTEASAAAIATAITSQLGGLGTASAVDSNNVKITSNLSGPGSSVKLSKVPASLTTKVGLSDADNSALCGKLIYGTGAFTLAIEGYIPSAAGATAASVTASNNGPYNLDHGMTIVGDVDYGGSPSNDTATITAVAATVTGTGGSFASLSNETFICTVTGYDPVTVTMATEATIALAVQKINNQLLGAHCEAVDANNVKIVSDQQGTGVTITLSSVAAGITTKLGLANNATASGTGNVANVNAVTVAELKTILEAAWNNNGGVTVTASGSAFKISSNTTGTSSKVKVDTSSTARTILGLATTAAIGTASSSGAMTGDYISLTKYDGPGQYLIKVPNMQEGEELVVTGTAVGTSGKIVAKLSPLA